MLSSIFIVSNTVQKSAFHNAHVLPRRLGVEKVFRSQMLERVAPLNGNANVSRTFTKIHFSHLYQIHDFYRTAILVFDNSVLQIVLLIRAWYYLIALCGFQ